MSSLWKMRRSPTPRAKAAAAAIQGQTAPTTTSSTTTTEKLSIPSHFRCPISLDLMKDPITAPTGITYDRASIEAWLDTGHDSCPVTNLRIQGGTGDLIPNHTIRRMIQNWCIANRALGVDRIPTPRIPVTKAQATEMAKEIEEAARRGDAGRCAEVVGRVRERAKESDRNRRCMASGGGVARALAGAFDAFARKHALPADDQTQSAASAADAFLEEILAAFALTFASDQHQQQIEEASTAANTSATLVSLSSPSSVRSLACIMAHSDFAARHNAVLAVKELVRPTNNRLSSASFHATSVYESEALATSLVSLIKNPISTRTTKASLVAAYHMVTMPTDHTLSNTDACSPIAERFVALGSVPLLIESLATSDRSTCEKTLGLLDSLCDCPAGREAAYAHALAVPVIVKKMLRVSDVATCFAVSILWKLCSGHKLNKDGIACASCCLREALQVGAFQKLLLVLQMGYAAATKDKVTCILKLLNTCRGTADCIESVDFKELKRSF